MKKIGLLFKWSNESYGIYYECYEDLETGLAFITTEDLTSISGK